MKLICLRGFNCHLGCVINVAALLGVRYQNAFSTLWSEMDFEYDQHYGIYASRRVLANLEAVGAKLDAHPCTSPSETSASVDSIPENERFIVGMDTYHIPWSPTHQHFHGPHYFIVQKKSADSLCCLDPIYEKDDVQISYETVISHSFDLCRVRKVMETALPAGIMQEALDMLDVLPRLEEKLVSDLQNCVNHPETGWTFLTRYIDALINNRCLFSLYLDCADSALPGSPLPFPSRILTHWDAIKNGIIKASIMKQKASVVAEVNGLLHELFMAETALANEILQTK